MQPRIVDLAVVVLLAPAVLSLPSTNQDFFRRQSVGWVVGQTVNTTSGPVSGHAASNNTEVSEYLGIPYAQPPVDELRWQLPVAYNGSEPINGTAFGYACMQAHPSLQAEHSLGVWYNITRGGYYVPDILLPDTPQSEDCLTLNVWTRPQNGEASKAVLVWIHGGSYTGGSSSEIWYNGQYIAEEQDIVLVSINYRLGIFGFPGSPNLELNLGLLDQRMALEWVRDNIAQFGGDPNRIVMFGQSAGAAAIDLHSYAYADDPIVSGFVLQSGTAWGFGLQTQSAAASLWYAAAGKVGCNDGAVTDDEIISCMAAVSSEELIRRLPPVPYGETPGLPYGPIIDGNLVFSSYGGRTPAAVPALIGNNDDESGLSKNVTPWWSRLPPWFWPIQNIYAYTCPAGQRAAVNMANGNPTWRYRWFGSFPNVLLPWIPYNGSWHGSELPSIFDTAPQYHIPNTDLEDAVGKYMRGAWAAFAKDPAEGLNNYDGWLNYNPSGNTLIRLPYGNNSQAGFTIGPSQQYDWFCT